MVHIVSSIHIILDFTLDADTLRYCGKIHIMFFYFKNNTNVCIYEAKNIIVKMLTLIGSKK